MRPLLLAALLVILPGAVMAQQAGGGYPFAISPQELVPPSPNGASFNPQSAFEQSPDFVYQPTLGVRLQLQGFKPAASGTGVEGGASLIAPIVGNWSGQLDIGASTDGKEATWGGAARVFTRTPDFSVGGTLAFVDREKGGSLMAIGPEAQVYLGQGAIEGWGGITVDTENDNEVGGFGMLDLAFYPSDDWRVAVGGALVDGWASSRVSTEYSMAGLGLPLSVTADARMAQDGSFRFGAGLTGYIGGAGDTVVGHDRYDFMPNRALDLASSLPPTPPPPVVPDEPEEPQCDEGEHWDGEGCSPNFPDEPICNPDEVLNEFGECVLPGEETPECPPGYQWSAGECTMILPELQ